MSNYESRIPEFKKALQERERKALEAIGVFVSGEAQLRAPVDSGNLKNSISHRVNMGEKSVTIGTSVHYAPFVEFGTGLYAEDGKGRNTPWSYQDKDGNWHRTSGQRPQPFLSPAIDENKERIRKLAREEMRIE